MKRLTLLALAVVVATVAWWIPSVATAQHFGTRAVVVRPGFGFGHNVGFGFGHGFSFGHGFGYGFGVPTVAYPGVGLGTFGYAGAAAPCPVAAAPVAACPVAAPVAAPIMAAPIAACPVAAAPFGAAPTYAAPVFAAQAYPVGVGVGYGFGAGVPSYGSVFGAAVVVDHRRVIHAAPRGFGARAIVVGRGRPRH